MVMGDMEGFIQTPTRVTRGEQRIADVVLAGLARSVPGNASLVVPASGARELYMDANQLLEAIRMIVREEVRGHMGMGL